MSDLAPAPDMAAELQEDPHDGPLLPVLGHLVGEIAVYSVFSTMALAALSLLT